MANKPRLWYGRHKLLFWVITGLLVLYALAGFVVAPMVIQHLLHTRISQSLQRKIQVDTVRVNPLTYSIRLKGLAVADRDGSDFIKIGDFFVNLDPLSSLFKWGIVIKSIVIHEPQLHIVRLTADRFNFSDLLTSPQGKAAPVPSKPLRLVLGNLSITAGRLRFDDHAQGMPFESLLSALTVDLKGLDTQSGAEACRYRLSARSEADETLEVDGEARIQPLTVQAKVDLKQLAPAKYAPYYQHAVNAKIADGRVDLGTTIQWSDTRRRLDDLKLAVSSLVLENISEQQTLVRLPQFGIEGADIDLKAHRIGLGRITSRDGTLNVRRDAQGQLNLLAAFRPKSTQQGRPAESMAQASPENPSAWQIRLPELILDNYSVDFQDHQPTPAVQAHLRQISFTARNLSTQPQQQGQVDLALQWADQGAVSAQGQTVLDPFQVELNVVAKALDIRPLQPYLQEFVQLVITKGLFDAQGHLNVATTPTAPQIRFTGQAALNSLEAVDADKAALFAKWKSLYLSGIEVQTEPLRVQIDKVALTDFFNRLLIEADGTVNVETIIGRKAPSDPSEKPSDAKAAEEKKAAAPTPPADGQETRIVIKTVTLQGGQIDYSDKYIKPNVHLIMKELGGRISGLDNIKQNRADVLLRGVVGGNLPMQIKGQVNPLIPKPYINLSMNFPGIDLSPFAPYSGKYIGYSLEKGQLAMNLSYKVVDNKLAGQNKIELNQLAFGDPVASPQATKLPVKLAVALLKDRQGNIELDLPVSGDLNDPEFSLGGVILKMFIHLIREIVSAPFKMLGALFGGGEELAYLDFDPGQVLIAPQRTEKLDTLAKILFERPGLKLEIQGQIDPESDTEGLRQQGFETELKATKLKALVAQGHKALPLDQIVLDPQERERMIRKAFDAATFPKPRDDKGQLKKLSPPEMEKLLYAATEVSADDLRALAYQRASAAKAYLQSTGKIDPGRLFIVEPQIEGLKEKQGLKARVKFNLK
jgi:hypothetical protein